MKNYIILLCLAMLIGCAPPKVEPPAPPKLMPPMFAKADMVRVIASPGYECGYVIALSFDEENVWQYQIMFQQENIVYGEKELSLIKRAVWYDETAKPLPSAEFVTPEDFEALK